MSVVLGLAGLAEGRGGSPMTATILSLRNWWCPKCRTWLAHADVLCGKHVVCKTAVEWLEFVPEVFRVEDDKKEPLT